MADSTEWANPRASVGRLQRPILRQGRVDFRDGQSRQVIDFGHARGALGLSSPRRADAYENKAKPPVE
jgi:hypothetical protein